MKRPLFELPASEKQRVQILVGEVYFYLIDNVLFYAGNERRI